MRRKNLSDPSAIPHVGVSQTIKRTEVHLTLPGAIPHEWRCNPGFGIVPGRDLCRLSVFGSTICSFISLVFTGHRFCEYPRQAVVRGRQTRKNCMPTQSPPSND